jgi:hypothetical protein
LEDRYDTVNQTLAPLIALLTRNGSVGNHSLNLEASIVDVAGLPEQMKGDHLRIAYEFPDKLLVQFPSLGGTATVCRNRQSVWAFPAAMFIPLVERIEPSLSTQPLPPIEISKRRRIPAGAARCPRRWKCRSQTKTIVFWMCDQLRLSGISKRTAGLGASGSARRIIGLHG